MKPPTISVNLYDPLLRADFKFYRRVTPDTYAHTINAFGGYDTATITLAMTQTEAEDWLESGLMRHVKVYAAALDSVWQGFVDSVKVNLGPLSVTYGPLLNMANRVYVMYSPTSEGASGFVFGTQAVTMPSNNTDSQDRYGIMPAILSGSTMAEANALIQRDTHLGNNGWPKLTQDWTDAGSRPVTVTLNCKGYFHLLNYPYINALSGATNAYEKIIQVLQDTPNSAWLAFDTSYPNITYNFMQVPIEEIQLRIGLSIIKGIVAMGDDFFNRWMFYISNDLRAHYHIAPFSPSYRAYIQQGGVILQSSTQGTVEPWRMKPGWWLAFDDFLVGRNTIETASDPRMMFVERLSYRAPFGLQLQGGNRDEIVQVLAQFGMGGTS